MRAPRRALVLALLACLLPLWPAFAQEDATDALIQRLLSTPLPAELLDWSNGIGEPYLDEAKMQDGYEGMQASIEIFTGQMPLYVEDSVAYSTVSYDVYREPWQAEQGYAGWKANNLNWLTDQLWLDGEPFVAEAMLRADPDIPIAVCATVVGNVVVFVSLQGGDEVWPDALYGTTAGNCRGAVRHLQSLL